MDDLPSEGRPRFPIHPRWLAAAILAPVIASSGCAQVQSASQEIGARLKAQADYTWKQLQQPKVGTTAASFLKHIRHDRDPNARYVAYAKLADPNCYSSPEQKHEAVKTLVTKFETGGEPVACRAVIVHTLGQLRDPQARETVLKAVDDPEPIIRAQACRALGMVGKKEDATVLTRKMTVDTLVDCRIAAIEALGELKPDDKRIPLVLVNGMQHDEPAVRLASVEALRKITGKDLGGEPGPWIKMIQPETLAAKPSSPTAAPARSRRATDADTKQASLPPATAPSAGTDAPVELPPGR